MEIAPRIARGLSGKIGRNRLLAAGIAVVLGIALFGLLGQLFIDPERADVGAGKGSLPPALLGGEPGYFLGTDVQGRDVLADVIMGTPGTMRVGIIAGAIGILIATILGFTSAYFGGLWDNVVILTTDVLMTVPGLLILIIIVSMVSGLSLEMMALFIALLAWPGPTRAIRAQVLTMRERAYIQVAKLNGVSDLKIIVKEMIPNLFPFLAAGFVGASAGAVLASIGLHALGLGPHQQPSLGLTIYWAIQFNALIRDMWWWWTPPIILIVGIFLGLFMITAGLDQVANPRLRTRV